MKTFSNFNSRNVNENCVTADVNPGNALSIGVTNHLTPVQNIVTNIRNLFSPINGVVASVAEDGFSVKLNSSKFVSEKDTKDFLYKSIYQNQSLYTFISQQGLPNVKLVNLGQYFVVYFGPDDIKAAEPGAEPAPCTEMIHDNIDESELSTIFEADDEDEELEQITKSNLKKIISAKDKVKAAKQFGILVAQQISLPREFYFAGVKSKDGDESIALRWKFIKRRPHNKSTEITHSLMNIYGLGKDAVWIGDYDKDSIYNLPDEVKKLIESILELLDAEKTSDVCVYKIEEEKEKKEEDDKKEDDKEDSEDDDSRGDDSDKDDDKKDASDDLL